jgi:WNK lysine deficient protein kinase
MDGSVPKEDEQVPIGNDPGASPSHRGDNDEDEVAEQDPEGRYYRYGEVVGRGRFKRIFKAFDTQIGIDVAWSKLAAEPHHLSDEQLQEIAAEMSTGLDLDHPNIIKCFKCWKDTDGHCINLITELFTSGNLRQYRNLHKHLDLKAVKRMARQILKGLDYLHSKQQPVVHGDLRCDKIYVNGHSGEIKIGDLGLATLISKRWEESDQEPPPNMQQKLKDPRVDIFAFGLCMLELLTLKQLDPQHYSDYRDLVNEVQDGEAARFISSCLGDWENRPGAAQLLEDPFLQVKKTPPADSSKEGQPSEPLDAGRQGAEGMTCAWPKSGCLCGNRGYMDVLWEISIVEKAP